MKWSIKKLFQRKTSSQGAVLHPIDSETNNTHAFNKNFNSGVDEYMRKRRESVDHQSIWKGDANVHTNDFSSIFSEEDEYEYRTSDNKNVGNVAGFNNGGEASSNKNKNNKIRNRITRSFSKKSLSLSNRSNSNNTDDNSKYGAINNSTNKRKSRRSSLFFNGYGSNNAKNSIVMTKGKYPSQEGNRYYNNNIAYDYYDDDEVPQTFRRVNRRFSFNSIENNMV
ncbi:uncharacterized protein SCDLUD_001968 [Saccharomycodes ludwigii]|uniref:uncharacterized protein n=1 Tax=Saccharomycodes ludwigii TaxID=36035 RepID=UPI001E87C919|nr:hypothetical protein SCDLUD_001968 [Saccharomycodes ludwigii]KAH3902155.1 hypothetical protein SCDLUD_001968 [Saccharomycodes ludwigii]